MTKNKKIAIICIILIIIATSIAFGFKIIYSKLNNQNTQKSYSKESIQVFTSFKDNINSNNLKYKNTFINSIEELDNIISYYEIENEIDYSLFNFDNNNYLVSILMINECGEEIIGNPNINIIKNDIELKFTVKSKCGFCADAFKIHLIPFDKEIDIKDFNVKYDYKFIKNHKCDDYEIDKPIIYIYPTETIDLRVKLVNDKNLTSTYPKYNNYWDIIVDVSGNIYDKKTNRNYYALYWEGIDNSKLNMSEGFVIKGEDTISFLEEKLEYLGLNEREINEFIIYWLPKMENNKYNFIRFKTLKEINDYMPLEFSEEPDTLIRVIMEFKPLSKKISVEKQTLIKQERFGFTVVEWGGREIKE